MREKQILGCSNTSLRSSQLSLCEVPNTAVSPVGHAVSLVAPAEPRTLVIKPVLRLLHAPSEAALRPKPIRHSALAMEDRCV